MYSVLRILAAFLICCTAEAATLQQLSMDQMTQSATAIVRARVTGSSATFSGTTIYTHYALQTEETWKGTPVTEVMLPGGVAGGYRQSFPGVPTLTQGSDYVLFLWTSAGGITHLVGLTQGLFSVHASGDGSLQAARPGIGETMLDSAGRKVADQPVSMRVADMKVRVSQALRSGPAQ